MPAHEGSCLCGQTKITVEKKGTQQALCHCLDCQQTSGSAYVTVAVVSEAGLKVEGPTKVFESPSESGRIIYRTFCSNCGSQLTHKSSFMGKGIAVLTGNLPDFAHIPITTEMYVKDRWSVLPAIEGATQFHAMPPGVPPFDE
ncbi:hypothetical protein BDN72DRAFT_859945 [Pluteus cervinus]|uniref:Uncharacterized protein n=1 Tax=Pluteus cervinus TaxID=181527 RepID=A0ACD3ALK1_9AGAR|nr:hypothetical protein BDN72DRAFT_859945 [Pluteus cervinus]